MKTIRLFFWLVLLLPKIVFAQDAHVVGHVRDEKGKMLSYVSVRLSNTSIGCVTDESGHYFLKDLPEGKQVIEFSFLGYVTETREVNLAPGSMVEMDVVLREESFMMENVVITSNRYETKARESATIVNVIPPMLMENTSAHCISDVLGFQTGLRVEQNCSNCGVPSLRINGMEGQYSQLLLDSHPIFSSLASVYGLEQIPASMVDRIEVIRGGGSALFGANAIAGVVNVITKEPTRDFVNVDHSTSYMESGAFDFNSLFNASVVAESQRAGVFFFGSHRHRDAYDRDCDGFSDMPLLDGSVLGFRSFFRTSDFSKLTVEYHHAGEYRRGGCDLDQPPHETDLAEQLRHSIDAGSLRWEWYSKDNRHRISNYWSAQNTARESYFGTAKNLDAYGRTHDITAAAGLQYRFSYPFVGSLIGDLTSGIEYVYNRLHDRMLGYDRDFVQNANVVGGYVQNEWKNEKVSMLIGGRLEKHNLLERPVFSPRLNFRYAPKQDNVVFRLTYASGYRAPQAYDEDLHVGAVGGEVSLISLDPDLRPEYSHSFSGSVDLYHRFQGMETNFTLEGFFTRLNDAFALVENGHDAQGNLLLTRVNTSGVQVYGLNAEGKMALRKSFVAQVGYTWQRSRYVDDFVWSENPAIAPQRRLFRTPDHYGYFYLTYLPVHDWTISLNGKLTGRMLVQHFEGYVDQDEEVLTDPFFEMGMKVSKEIEIYKYYTLELNAGVKNLLNQFQRDLDKGKDRDAGYIYGPALPRTWFVGLNLKI